MLAPAVVEVDNDLIEFSESDSTLETVGQLKHALSYMQRPLIWDSNDGAYRYIASPLDEEPDYATVGDIPIGIFREQFNAWLLLRISAPDVNSDVTFDDFRLFAGQPLLANRFEVPSDLVDEEKLGELMDMLEKEHTTQTDLGLNHTHVIDYAIVDNAVFDLAPIAKQEFEERLQARLSMTEDERRWERMQKYGWLVGPELDKTGGPKWWGFSEGSVVHAVRAFSPDEAAAILEEHHGHELFPLFFVELYPDDAQPEFEAKFSGREIVRLIPFSDIEWPDDPESLSEEQKAAFERLKPKDPK